MPGKYSLKIDLKAKAEILALEDDTKAELAIFLKSLGDDPFGEKVQNISAEYSEDAYDSVVPCGCHVFWEAIRRPGHLSILDHPSWTTIRVLGASFYKRYTA